MSHIVKYTLVAMLGIASFAAVAASSAPVSVSQCWIRALPGDLPSGGYFKVTNSANRPIDLTAVKSNAFGMAMLHRSEERGGMSSMAPVANATVPAEGSLTFAPGNYHVMLEKPKAPLVVGSTIALTFIFSDGENVTASCAVKGAGAAAN